LQVNYPKYTTQTNYKLFNYSKSAIASQMRK
jgi:hypothetical protein